MVPIRPERFLLLAVALLAAIALAPTLVSPRAQDTSLPVEMGGGAAGGNALVLNGWDIRGPRNVQGGWLTDNPESLNLDVGAGSTANPGWVVLNYDIGKGEKFFAGEGPTRPRPLLVISRDGSRFYSPAGRLLAWFGNTITFYVRPRVQAMRLR